MSTHVIVVARTHARGERVSRRLRSRRPEWVVETAADERSLEGTRADLYIVAGLVDHRLAHTARDNAIKMNGAYVESFNDELGWLT